MATIPSWSDRIRRAPWISGRLLGDAPTAILGSDGTWQLEEERIGVLEKIDSRADIVLSVIRERRSVKSFRPDSVPRQLVELVLEAAVWAPNHHLTQPWRFFVLTGDARHVLGEVLASDPTLSPAKREAARQKPLRAPVVIAVAVEPDPARPLLDELCAGAAAIQNMLLVAHALGLGAIWRTGRAVELPAVREFFGLSERAVLLGFIYLGYPATFPAAPARHPATECTVWLDSHDGLAGRVSETLEEGSASSIGS